MNQLPDKNELVQLSLGTGHKETGELKRKGGEYYSCRFIEGGASFTYSDIRSCATRHHGRGAPFIQDMRGPNPRIDLHEIIRNKDAIREANQKGGHPDCKGCPRLQLKKWPESEYLFDWIAITNYIHCNLRCTFCWLTYAPHSPYNRDIKIPGQRYSVAELINELMENKQLSPIGVVDWGGGGEPTLIPEFDELFQALSDYGVKQVIHTNAVRLPSSVKSGTLNGKKLIINCSIDSGTRESYLQIKGRDHFDQVIENLKVYQQLGAQVWLKYIVQECNCDEQEIASFLQHVKDSGFSMVMTDVDHREEELTPQIKHALFFFRDKAAELGLYSLFQGCGSHNVDRDIFDELNSGQNSKRVA